jgi:predicted ATPase
MKLEVENFGPITYADIELKPLTVLIGKNNTGKSMLAQLIFTLMGEWYILNQVYVRTPLRSETYDYLRKKIMEAKELTPRSYVEMILDVMIDYLTQIFNKSLRDRLERNFAVAINSLVNLNSDHTKVECTYSKYLTIEFKITKESELSAKFDVKKEELIDNMLKDKNINYIIDIIIHRSKRRREFKSALTSMIILSSIDYIAEKIVEFLFSKELLMPTLYIPAGRAGLLEGYKVVYSAEMRLLPVAPLRDISMPQIPGMASEFYNLLLNLLELKEERGPFEKVSDLFKELIEGDIMFEKLKQAEGKMMIYKFKFKDKEFSIDLINASSMVKELSPIYLVLRKLVKKGYLLIIEEPESHLHPAAQIKLMEIFGKLVNEGVNILITTHSDLLLRKLTHLMMEGSIRGKSNANLVSEDVAVYLLKPNEKGYIAQEVNILEEMPTFDEVIEQLYEEEKKLSYSLL